MAAGERKDRDTAPERHNKRTEWIFYEFIKLGRNHGKGWGETGGERKVDSINMHEILKQKDE